MYNENDEMDDLFDDVIDPKADNPQQDLPDFITEGQFDNVEDVELDSFDKNPKVVAPVQKTEDDDDFQEDGYEDNGVSDTDELDANTSFILDLLKQKGINDPEKILFLDDEGKEVEKSFYDLDYEEQLNILNTSPTESEHDLDDSEIDLINSLRENNLSVEDLIEYYKNEAVEDYKRSLNNESTEIDSLSDEEIYILDLKATYDLSDEEILAALDHEMNNEVLFKRKVDKLRDEYKQAEEQQRIALSESEKAKLKEEFETLYLGLNEVAINTEDIGGIDLSDEDKDEIMGLILEKDINNKSNFDKLLSDPDQMFKMAWFATKGQEAFDILHNYYKDQIESVRKTAYEKGKKEATPKKETTKDEGKKAFAIKRKPTKNNVFGDDEHISLEDLY